MDSTDLAAYGIRNWRAIRLTNKDKVIVSIPILPGVYVFRTKQDVGRVRAGSDIAYIGKGTGPGGVQGRVREHFVPGSTGTTSGRVYQFMADGGWKLEIGWLIRAFPELADAIERQMMEAYELDHHELPPINRSMPHG